MYKLVFIFSVLSFLYCKKNFAQNRQLQFANAQSIDQNRYKDIKGSPMLFDTWAKATMYDNLDKAYKNVLLNYNGLTQEVEVRKSETEFIVLDATNIERIEIENTEAPDGTIILKKGILPNLKKDFVEIVFKGKNNLLVKHLRVRKVKSTINDVGKVTELESFAKSTNYYLVKNGKAKPLKTKRKALLKELGKANKLGPYIKKEKLNVKNDKDLNKLFNFYESLGE